MLDNLMEFIYYVSYQTVRYKTEWEGKKSNMKHKETIGFAIHSLDNLITRKMIAYAAQNEVDELTVMHGWIIGYLYDNSEKEIFQKDIEAEFSIGRSTVTGILKLMEKKGYIIRKSVPYDARLKKLVLTELGIKMNEKTRYSIDTMDEDIISCFTKEEAEEFLRLAQKLKNSLCHQAASFGN